MLMAFCPEVDMWPHTPACLPARGAALGRQARGSRSRRPGAPRAPTPLHEAQRLGPRRPLPDASAPSPPPVGKSISNMEESVTLDNGGFAALELNSRHLNVKNTFSKKNGTR